MKRARLLAGLALALTSAWAIAQDAPESLLPPGFDDPQPAPAPAAAPRVKAATPPSSTSSPGGSVSEGAVPGTATSTGPDSETSAGSALPHAAGIEALKKLSLDQLEKMTPEELEDALGLSPTYDMPPAARRALSRIGIIDEAEGGLPSKSLANQNASLVRASMVGNNGQLVSRWGHILLRRALASRLDSPQGMQPAEFAALRAALLLRMGEADAARALVQDVDAGNFNDDLADAALDAYAATSDFAGVCPVVFANAGGRKEPKWEVAQEICRAFRGEPNAALARLDRAQGAGKMARIDLLLAQRYAGSAGKARRAVTIEWDEVKDMTPWRYGLALAVGIEPPAKLLAGREFEYMAATAPMLGLARRAEAADSAAGAGILSSTAMVDLYSQIYADDEVSGESADRAGLLRDAYVSAEPAARLLAMQQLWNGAKSPQARHSRAVLTAFAAARMPVDSGMSDAAGPLIASMLTAGLDRNALRWAKVAEVGSEAWALLTLASPSRGTPVDESAVDDFVDNDDSVEMRKSAFLIAGLAGLGRIDRKVQADFDERLKTDLTRKTRWSALISKAADVNNQSLVALLAGVGMQGSGWDRMTPRHLYHIVSALRRVGLEAEARMIAAEAVARG